MSDEVVNQVRKRLRDAGLPGSLLPATVKSLQLDEASGRFTVTLTSKTVLNPAGHTVTYQPTIKGRLGQALLDELDGVTVKFGLLHPAISRIQADAARTTLTFTVMGTKNDVPYSAFEA